MDALVLIQADDTELPLTQPDLITDRSRTDPLGNIALVGHPRIQATTLDHLTLDT